MLRLGTVSAATIAAGPAFAHSFEAGADAYGRFVEGATVILVHPTILLPLVALGILLGLWDEGGLPTVWPVFLSGQLAGVAAASVSGPAVAVAFIGLGLATASAAALLPAVPRWLAFSLSGLVGAGALAASLEGQGLLILPIFTHLGLLFGVNLATAAAEGLARFAVLRVDAPWMRIGWRVAASWIAAILLLMLAFELTGGVS